MLGLLVLVKRPSGPVFSMFPVWRATGWDQHCHGIGHPGPLSARVREIPQEEQHKSQDTP